MRNGPAHAIAVAYWVGLPALAAAQTDDEQAAARERCAIRVSIALFGKSPSAALMAEPDPRAKVPQLLASPDFIERFARFINATFNEDPGDTAPEDATYYLAQYILANGKPWKEMFLGPYRVDKHPTISGEAIVMSDAAGLGYFRSPAWMRRYGGNETDGYRILAAYRMMNNTIGLRLTAAVNTTGVNAAGRQGPECAGCHYNSVFALDLSAKILSRRKGMGDTMTFLAPTEGPQTLLGGMTIADDAQFVTALVESEAFRFRTCRVAFEFLYGRPERSCEGPVFHRCMTEFEAKGTMPAALAAVAKDATFCQ